MGAVVNNYVDLGAWVEGQFNPGKSEVLPTVRYLVVKTGQIIAIESASGSNFTYSDLLSGKNCGVKSVLSAGIMQFPNKAAVNVLVHDAGDVMGDQVKQMMNQEKQKLNKFRQDLQTVFLHGVNFDKTW